MIRENTWRALAVAAACVLLVACTSKASRIESGLRKGAEYVQQGNWGKASVEARNVLQMDPKNARAYLIAAQVEDSKAAYRNAYAAYMKAIELKPDFVDAKVGLARVYLRAGELDLAGKLIAEVLAAEPANLRARALLAATMSRQGHMTEAVAEADKIVAAAQTLPADSSLALAGLYFNANDPAAALRVLDRALASDSRNPDLLQMAAEIAADRRSGDAFAAAAVKYYKAATQEAPGNDALWKGWARFHVRRTELDLAESVLREAIRVEPDDSARTLSLLEFVVAFRGADAAEREFSAAIAAKPKDTTLRFALADFYGRSGRADDSRRVLEEIVALGRDVPSGLAARSRLAALQFASGQVAEARAVLADVLKANPRDADALVLQGRILLGDGKPQDAIIDLRAAAKDRPGSAEIARLLAQAHHAAGEPQLARDVLADAVKFKLDDPQLHLLLAADMAGANEVEAAGLEADEAIKVAPKYLPAYAMKVELASARGDTAAAEKAALTMRETFPNDISGYVALGKVYAQQKRPDAALKQFDAAASAVPSMAVPTVSAIALLVGQRRFAEANARIDALAAAHPNSSLALELRGEVALAKGDLALAEQSFRGRLGVVPVPPAAYKNLAAVMIARKNLTGALAVLDEGERANPKDVTLADARAEWLTSAGRPDDAIAVYEAALRRAPQSDVTANNLAYVLVEVKRDRASLDRALQLASRFDTSTTPGYMDTLGWVHYRLGQYDKAASVFERALALAPNEPVLQLHLGMALVRNGDLLRGREFVRRAIDSKARLPDVAEARSLVAQG